MKAKKSRFIKAIAALVFLTTLAGFLPKTAKAQDREIREYILMAARGKMDEVKKALPELLAKYPENPGVIFLHAVALEDAEAALDKYLLIIARFPRSEWADDAYWRVVQYYAVKGDLRRAEAFLRKFREKYPTSEFLFPATEIVRDVERKINAEKKEEREKAEKKNEETDKIVGEELSGAEKREKDIFAAKYALQVGAFSAYEKANEVALRLKAKRLIARVKEKKSGDKTVWAVLVGGYASRAEAEKAIPIIVRHCQCQPMPVKLWSSEDE